MSSQAPGAPATLAMLLRHMARFLGGFAHVQDSLQLPLVTLLSTQLWGPSSQQLLPTLALPWDQILFQVDPPKRLQTWALLGERVDSREEGTSWACSMSWRAGNMDVGKVAKPGSQMQVECQHPVTCLLPGQEEE